MTSIFRPNGEGLETFKMWYVIVYVLPLHKFKFPKRTSALMKLPFEATDKVENNLPDFFGIKIEQSEWRVYFVFLARYTHT